MSRKPLALTFLLAATFAHATAQGTHLWSQSRYDELEKGRPHGVAIHSDGTLTAGPKSTELFATPSTYVWAIDSDTAGNAYLATGSPATVLKVSPDGKSTKLFETKEFSIQAIRTAPDGTVYAATLPSGKLYKLSSAPTGKTPDETTAAVAFDTAKTEEKPKYIWDLAFDAAGRLYIATGAPAAIYRIDPKQPAVKPELFYKSDEQSIRCLAFDPHGDLIAGSDGSGLLYRIDKAGKAFVLFDAPRREITSIAIGERGAIYLAGVGDKGRNSLPPLPVTGNTAVTATITFSQPASVQASNNNGLIPDGSEIFEIAPNGAPRKLWSSKEDIVYALRQTPQGLLAASGNRGHIYRIHSNGDYEDIAHLESGQATAFAPAPGGFYIATANSGKVFTLTNENDPTAYYESEAFDATVFSRWGRAEVNPAGGGYDLYARVGNVENPQRAWSDWIKLNPNTRDAALPSARFLQWKAIFHGSASIASVAFNYLPVNVAPTVDELVVQPGARVNPNAQFQQQPPSINIVFPSAQNNPISFSENSQTGPLAGLRDKTAVTARWAARDENGDELSYALYYRADNDSEWLLLKDKITERFYTFDAALIPDGGYRLKVVATDALSHNPGEALTAERISDRFTLDTTPPVITVLTAQIQSGTLHVTATATDSASPVARAEYSIDAGPWQYIEPTGKLSDSLTETYDFTADLKPQGTTAPETTRHIVTLRVYDRYENVATAKTLVH